MFTSYAQNFEDVMLWRALRRVGPGFYIDIGAQDPVVDSVSMGFYEQGWRGVHVEPVASYAGLLRAQRPDEIVIEAAVGAARGRLKLFEIPGTGLSTADPAVAHRQKEAGYSVREVEVVCTTLEEVLAPHAGREIHWLKIDVEGSERDVLRGWGSGAAPWIVVIESTLPVTRSASQQDWEPLVLERGYRFAYFDGLNRFYVSSQHADLAAAFGYGPGVFDGFQLSGTATAPYCTRLNARLDQSRARELAASRLAEEAAVRAERAEAHARAAEAHIAAMTSTVSWRVTAPLRRLRRMLRAKPREDNANSIEDEPSTMRRAFARAKRTGVYARLAPWMRERYPKLWSRAKRMLLERAPRVRAKASRGDESHEAPIRNYVPHNSADATLDEIAARGSISAQQVRSLLEIEISRLRKR